MKINVLIYSHLSKIDNLFSCAFETLGISADVYTASSASEILRDLDYFSIDMIIRDHWMPELSCGEMLEEMRGRGFKDIPVIILSGHAHGDWSHEMLRTGVHGILYLPFKLEDIQSAIRGIQ